VPAENAMACALSLLRHYHAHLAQPGAFGLAWPPMDLQTSVLVTWFPFAKPKLWWMSVDQLSEQTDNQLRAITIAKPHCQIGGFWSFGKRF
jgi:hypothetical protein